MSSTTSTLALSLPEGYVEERDRPPVPDVAILDRLTADAFDLHVDTVGPNENRQLRVTLYSGGSTVSLERVLRLLGSLDLEVEGQRTSVFRRADGLVCRLYDFRVSAGPLVTSAVASGSVEPEAVLETFRAMWSGCAEADRFNVLVLAAGLDWREVVLCARTHASCGRVLCPTTRAGSRRSCCRVLSSRPRSWSCSTRISIHPVPVAARLATTRSNSVRAGSNRCSQRWRASTPTVSCAPTRASSRRRPAPTSIGTERSAPLVLSCR